MTRTISSNTTTAITVSSAFPRTPATGDTFRICYTGNDLWNLYPTGNCDAVALTNCNTTIHPTTNDSIVVTVVAQIQVVTPLVRPFFGCANGNNPRCDVPITSRAVARYEGPFV